jgi:predicted acyltransferase
MNNRLLSLDVMRGLIMLLLAGEAALVYDQWNELSAGTSMHWLAQQFKHHRWHGLRFWDLIQPGFMTMAGTAMYLSFYYKQKKGIGWRQNLPHILKRSLLLFLFGTGLHCIYAGKLVWELWNVLTQLAFTTLIAYLIIRKSYLFQIVFSLAMILLSEILYRTVLVGEFDQPFVLGKNFGAYIDSIVMGKVNSGGWVFINFLPTSAHTIWGVLAGKLLMDEAFPQKRKLNLLLMSGLALLVAGYALDLAGISPIIKRICTGSFVLVSGGWIILLMVFLYWLIDIRENRRHAWIFSVMGTNALFIYLFFETVGMQWMNGVVHIFVPQAMLSALVSWFLYWALCYWLYQKKIFFKI